MRQASNVSQSFGRTSTPCVGMSSSTLVSHEARSLPRNARSLLRGSAPCSVCRRPSVAQSAALASRLEGSPRVARLHRTERASVLPRRPRFASEYRSVGAGETKHSRSTAARMPSESRRQQCALRSRAACSCAQFVLAFSSVQTRESPCTSKRRPPRLPRHAERQGPSGRRRWASPFSQVGRSRSWSRCCSRHCRTSHRVPRVSVEPRSNYGR